MVFSVIWTFGIIGTLEILQHPHFLWVMLGLLPLMLIIGLYQLFDAGHGARRSSSNMLSEPALRYMIGLGLGVGAVLLYRVAIDYAQNNWFQIAYSPTPSMSPAVSPGDLFLILRQEPFTRWDIIGLKSPDRPVADADVQKYVKLEGDRIQVDGDTVIVNGVPHELPPSQLVKRVVGLPGDTVEITGSALLINGKPTTVPSGVGPYIPTDTNQATLTAAAPGSAATGCWGNPITLHKNEYYLLGDNSPVSGDSRYFYAAEAHQPGAIPRDMITGRVVARIWPPSRWIIFDSSAPPDSASGE
jgi:signal peptidase I